MSLNAVMSMNADVSVNADVSMNADVLLCCLCLQGAFAIFAMSSSFSA